MLGLWFPGCFGLVWGWYNIGLRRGGFRGWRSGRLVGLGVGGFWWFGGVVCGLARMTVLS